MNLDGTDRGDALIAFDAVDAGIGDRVLVVTEGFSAMTAVGRPQSPIDMAVIGFIDQIDLAEMNAVMLKAMAGEIVQLAGIEHRLAGNTGDV